MFSYGTRAMDDYVCRLLNHRNNDHEQAILCLRLSTEVCKLIGKQGILRDGNRLYFSFLRSTACY